MNNVIPFHYEGHPVHFSADGWLDATAISSRFGKEPNAWLVSVDTMSYMMALATGLGLEIKPEILQEFNKINGLDSSRAASKARVLRLVKGIGLVKTKAGAPINGGGTWLHPKLAVFFARWLDVGFAVWCDLHIDALLRGELTEKQRFDQACKRLDDGKKKASQSGRDLAIWKKQKPPLEREVEIRREQLQMILGLEFS